MPRVTRASGLTIDAPDTFRIVDGASPQSAGTGPLRRGRAGVSAETASLLAAMEAQEMAPVDSFGIEPAPGSQRSRGPGAASAGPVQIALPVHEGQDAILLIEQGGVYSWAFPDSTELTPQTASRRGPRTPATILHFNVPIDTTPRPGELRRGFLSDVVFEPIIGHALTFTARLAIGGSIRVLERNVHRGFVRMTAADPGRWLPILPQALKFPANRPARLLVFVHGTFSTTIGSFGALAMTPWGRALLEAAVAHYDAVLGFDHATLGDDPLVNASELLGALEAMAPVHPPQIDVIAFSRGGLVFRALVEHLLPSSTFRGQIARAVFVGCTNGGTLFANPANWRALIDLYTNLAIANFRLLRLMPQAAAADLVFQNLVQGLGTLLKHLATSANEDVPGLACMRPDGEFITTLNQKQEGQPETDSVSYFAITSEFQPSADGNDDTGALPRRLMVDLAAGVIGHLMGEANDLIVNTASMTAIDRDLGAFVRDTLPLSPTEQVYHTVYFTRPEVAGAIARWLQLPPPPQTVSPTRATPTTRTSRMPVDLPSLVGPREMILPALVDTNIVAVEATLPGGDLRALIEEKCPSYLVATCNIAGERYHYAFRPEEVLAQLDETPALTVLDALALSEDDRSAQLTMGSVRVSPYLTGRRSASRGVVIFDGTPVGVVAEANPESSGMVDLARTVGRPTTTMDMVIARRSMPTFHRGLETPTMTGGNSRGARMPPHQPELPPGPIRRGPPPPVVAPQDQEQAQAPEAVTCHFLAEMDRDVLLNHATTIEVVVSRSAIAALAERASAATEGKVDPSSRLLIQVVPKENFVLVDPSKDRVEIDVPPAGQAAEPIDFDVKGTHVGEGEIWILVRQHQIGVAQLTLKAAIADRATLSRTRRTTAQAVAAESPRLATAIDQLLIVEQIQGDTVQYMFELDFASVNVFERHTSKALRVKRDDYVKELYKNIEDRYISHYDAAIRNADEEAFRADLQVQGVTLFDELFPLEVQQQLWMHRERLKSIRVVSTEPFIPWELVHLKAPGGTIDPTAPSMFLGEMGLVRWLHNVAGQPPTTLRVRPSGARYVIPDYPHPDWKLPATEQERDYLEAQFHATAVTPDPNSLRSLVTTPGAFDLLHFACHGEADHDSITRARVVLQGRLERGQFVPAYLEAGTVEFFGRLRGSDGSQPLVFLNACQAGRAGYKLTGIGGFAQAFLRAGAGVFVGTLWSVGDEPAFSFGRCFYDSLRAGKTVSDATIEARKAARSAGEATWLAYVVYAHPHATLT